MKMSLKEAENTKSFFLHKFCRLYVTSRRSISPPTGLGRKAILQLLLLTRPVDELNYGKL
jgi:hypothetical protein